MQHVAREKEGMEQQETQLRLHGRQIACSVDFGIPFPPVVVAAVAALAAAAVVVIVAVVAGFCYCCLRCEALKCLFALICSRR